MIEVVSFVAGVLVALVLVRVWRAWLLPAAPPAPPVRHARSAPAPDPRAVLPRPVPLDSRHLAMSLAEELANLACGVEGRAHQLLEAMTDRANVPRAAEALLAAVQRIRRLHDKLEAFGRADCERGGGSTALAPLIAQLGDELQAMQLGIELFWEPPRDLPDVAIAPSVVRESLLYLCGAMLRAERGATRLSVASEPCFTGAEPRLRLELVLEWITEGHAPAPALLVDPAFTLDLEASRQLLTANGGELTIHHEPGRSVRAVMQLPLASSRTAEQPAANAPAAPPDEQEAAEHRYGGALVLEADPSVRAMVASELKATGRAVFACADATSARTFLEATPDRFELLIVDHPQRLAGGDELAKTIRALAPALKIFVLSPPTPSAGEVWPKVHHIRKPFGVHELRHALASVLAAG